MAVKTFDETVQGLKLSADEKKLFDSVIAKAPELKEGWLRQDDYSRKQTEMKAKQEEYDAAVEYKTKMEPWSDKVYSTLESVAEKGWFDLEKGEEHFTDKYSEIEKQLEEAKALTGGDMDPQKLQEIVDARVKETVKNAGGLSKEEITALYKAETKTAIEEGFKEREADFNSKTIPFVAGFAAANAVVSARYERESGEKWTPEKQKEFFELMSKEGKFDPFALEDKLLEPVKAKKKVEADIEAEVQKRLAGRGMPGGGGERFIPQPPGGDARGLLQKALEESGKADAPDVRDSVRAGVVEGAKELVESGKF